MLNRKARSIRNGDHPSSLAGNVALLTQTIPIDQQVHQAQKMELLGRLTEGIAHDFNNILGIIIGNVEISREQLTAAEPLKKPLAEIKKAAERAANLTKRLLAFGSKQAFCPRVLDLNALVKDASYLLPKLVGEDIRIIYKFQASLGFIKADPGYIEQILMILAANALDAMPRNAKIVIKTENTELDAESAAIHPGVLPGSYVVLSFGETDCKLDRESTFKTFEPVLAGERPGLANTEKLATVNELVRQNDAHILAYNEPGKGMYFEIYFPRLAQSTKGLTPTFNACEPKKFSRATGADCSRKSAAFERLCKKNLTVVKEGRHEMKVKVLLVDDSSTALLMEQMLFRDSSCYEVVTARDGQQAVDVAVAEKPDLILMDVVMPKMDGFAACREIRKKQGLEMVPIIMVTSRGEPNNVETGFVCGCNDYLTKPINPIELLQVVNSYLGVGR